MSITIGVLRDTKNHEYRVSLLPEQAQELKRLGYWVIVEENLGKDVGFCYTNIEKTTNEEILRTSNIIIKVKEPTIEECEALYNRMKVSDDDFSIFCFAHFAANPFLKQLRGHIVAYEQGCYKDFNFRTNEFPILQAMSEVAGRLSILEGSNYLLNHRAGKGKIITGLPGVEPANVLIIGAGTVGKSAAELAQNLGANVIVADTNVDKLRSLPKGIKTIFSTKNNIRKVLNNVDIVIGSVYIPQHKAPKILDKEDISIMPNGSVFVDVSIDQGGCSETSRPTSHDDPVYIEGGVIHYCVPNIPGVAAHSSSIALCNASFPFILREASRISDQIKSKNLIDLG